MRKLFILLTLSIFLLSCSKDEENQERQHPLVGTFKIASITGNGQDYGLDTCFSNTLLDLREDRTGNHIIYRDNDNQCEIVLSGTIEWRTVSDGYTITSNIGLVEGFEDFGTKQGTIKIDNNDLTLIVFEDGVEFEIKYIRRN